MYLPCPVLLCKRGNKSGKRALALLKYMAEKDKNLCVSLFPTW